MEPGWHFRQLAGPKIAGSQWSIAPVGFSRHLGSAVVWIAYVSDWLIVTVTAVLPSIWLIARRRRQRGAGLCTTCGYDLRATPDRCPECGTVPAKHV